MASSHGDHTVRVVDCKTFKCVKTLKGHPRTPWCITFHPSSDQLLASGCLGGQVRVWNLQVNFVSVKCCSLTTLGRDVAKKTLKAFFTSALA